MTNVYLSRLPLKFMRRMAGFDAKGGDYFVARANCEPLQSLQRLVFPWVEEWEERFVLSSQGKGWEEGGLDQADISGHKFVKLLKHLRQVLLQDAAVLQLGK